MDGAMKVSDRAKQEIAKDDGHAFKAIAQRTKSGDPFSGSKQAL